MQDGILSWGTSDIFFWKMLAYYHNKFTRVFARIRLWLWITLSYNCWTYVRYFNFGTDSSGYIKIFPIMCTHFPFGKVRHHFPNKKCAWQLPFEKGIILSLLCTPYPTPLFKLISYFCPVNLYTWEDWSRWRSKLWCIWLANYHATLIFYCGILLDDLHFLLVIGFRHYLFYFRYSFHLQFLWNLTNFFVFLYQFVIFSCTINVFVSHFESLFEQNHADLSWWRSLVCPCVPVKKYCQRDVHWSFWALSE